MQLGEVFKFSSDQATGYSDRTKLHVFLAKTDHFRAPSENVFLFISSGDYGGCFPLRHIDYNSILTHDSFISCGNLVFYPDSSLKGCGAHIGSISPDHLKALRNHLIDHDVMPGWQITIACTALADAL